MNSSIPTEQFDGDMAVGRDITIGGNSAIRGSAKIGHNLIVNGWLEAKNIKAANKGLFKTEEQLRDAYPTPEKGWWALVAVQGSEATDHLGQLYISDGKKWVAQVDSSETPLLKGAPTIEHKEFMEAVEEMRASILNSERSRLQFEKANAPKFVPSKNLFNPNDLVSISIDDKGEIGHRNNWRGVYLPVQPGKQYSFSHSNMGYGEGGVGRLAFCDGSKNVLSTINMDTLPSSKDGMGKTVTIPQGCYFVFKNIVVLDNDYTNTFQFEEGERVTDYEPFKALVTQIGGSPIRDLELERRLDEMGHPLSLSDIEAVPSKNLFNPNDLVNISIDNEGEISRRNNWRGVYLPVQPGKKYSFSHSNMGYGEGGVGRLAFCDGSKNVLSTINMDTLPSSKDGMGKTVTIPQGCYFVFKNIVVLDNDYTNTFQFEEGERVTEYEPFKALVKKIAGFDLGMAKSQDTRRDIDCEIVFFGDSITDQRFSKWWKALPSMLSFKNKTNYARSGATWSHTVSTPYNITDLDGMTSANNVIWNQFNRMMSDISEGSISAPDVVIILAGTNDYSRPMGDVNSVFDWSVSYSNLDPTDERLQTVAGAIRYVCELLVKSFPTIRIILASPILRRDDNGNTMLVRNTIVECAKRMSIGIIDQTLESGFSPFNLPNLLIDGLHPNTDGGEVLARFLSGKIRSLL